MGLAVIGAMQPVTDSAPEGTGIIVTGASQGIGRSTAIRLARDFSSPIRMDGGEIDL
jgi:hypothetical protein